MLNAHHDIVMCIEHEFKFSDLHRPCMRLRCLHGIGLVTELSHVSVLLTREKERERERERERE